MRTRTTSFDDYGITLEEAKNLCKRCRNLEHDEKLLLMQCIHEVKPELEDPIYISLVTGASYDVLSTVGILMCCKKDDFYGWRRRALAVFARALEMCHLAS